MLKKICFLLVSGLSLTLFAQRPPINTVEANNTQYAFAIGEIKDTITFDWLANQGVLVNAKIGTFFTCQIPTSILGCIEGNDRFKSLQIATINNSFRSQNYAALRQSKVDKVNQGTNFNLSANYSGKGVIVGIVDIGFQTDHPTFFDSSGAKLRISKYWDQEASSGTPPVGYNYGKECSDSTSIVNQIDASGSHGTHVAGIAAGSGFGTSNLIHKGVAHEAELVFVKIKHTNDTLNPSALGDAIVANPTVIDAYKYIFDYANQVGKPAVINLSWGLHTGSHDGNSIFDKAVEQLTLKPGNVIVGANGNDGSSQMHFQYEFNNFDTIKTIAYDRGRGKTESVYVDIWGSKNTPFQLRVHLYDTNKNILASTPFFNTSVSNNTYSFISSGIDTLNYSIEIEPSFVYNQKPNLLFYSKHNNSAKNFVVLELVAEKGRIDAWNSGNAYEWSNGGFTNDIGPAFFTKGFKRGDVTHTMIENGGTGKGTISVGAYINRDKWINFDGKLTDNSSKNSAADIAAFSSEGPTVDGRIKPDISAPGQGIISSINRNAFSPTGNNRDNLFDSTNFQGKANYWVMLSGTSMASPHVCGIVALMLEANPKLTSESISDILKNTAVSDTFTGTVPNNKWGYGKVDALAAVKEAERLALSTTTIKEEKVQVYPNPTSQMVNIIFKVNEVRNYQLFDINGKAILTSSFDRVSNTLDISRLNAGVYFLKVSGIATVIRIVKY